MAYKYNKVPKSGVIFWIKLIHPYNGNHNHNFPPTMNVGDITWCNEEDTDYESNFHQYVSVLCTFK